MTRDEIEDYLKGVKRLVKKKYFKVIPREKNIDFQRRYTLNESYIRKLLLSIEVEDFIGIKDSDIFKGHKLYEFCKEFDIEVYGTIENVLTYIKLDNTGRNIRVDIVSIHEAEYTPNYYFKGGGNNA